MLTGRVDDFNNGNLTGWAFNTDAPDEHIVIRVNYKTQIVATGVANILREDLPDAGVGNGDHAFRIILPPNITSMQGLLIIAQSQSHGETPLPIATNDDRALDGLFHNFAQRYEGALIGLKQEIDALKERVSEDETSLKNQELPADLLNRFNRLETRMEAAEVFFVRIDGMMRQLVDNKKNRRKRFLGLF